MNATQIFRILAANRKRRDFPTKQDIRCRNGVIYPAFTPRFGIDFNPQTKVFTIGSCFTREIEEELAPLGVKVPTAGFSVPAAETPGGRKNGILNEYNPGTMSQRILNALDDVQGDERTLLETAGGVNDMLLWGSAPVTMARARARRAEIFELYRHLKDADVVIVTLGLVEAWYDHLTEQYLNGMPIKAQSEELNRFSVRRLDVHDIMPMFDPAFSRLAEMGKKVIVTVSPAPMRLTFFDNDCTVNNEFSKSVLRVCADRLMRRYANVDYFPSYEIVRSGGTGAYGDDNAHVRRPIVKTITSTMVQSYGARAAADAGA